MQLLERAEQIAQRDWNELSSEQQRLVARKIIGLAPNAVDVQSLTNREIDDICRDAPQFWYWSPSALEGKEWAYNPFIRLLTGKEKEGLQTLIRPRDVILSSPRVTVKEIIENATPQEVTTIIREAMANQPLPFSKAKTLADWIGK